MKLTAATTGDIDPGRLLDALARANRDAGRRVGDVVRRDTLAAARSSGRLTMSGMRAKLTVRTTVRAGPNVTSIEVKASPAGPWSIVEKGRRGGYVVKPRRKRAVTAGAAGPVASARPGPAPGRRVWSQARARVEPAIAKVIDEAFAEVFASRG